MSDSYHLTWPQHDDVQWVPFHHVSVLSQCLEHAVFPAEQLCME